MDGLKVNAGGKLAGSPTTTSRNESVCLQVKSPKVSNTFASHTYPRGCTMCIMLVIFRGSVILLKAIPVRWLVPAWPSALFKFMWQELNINAYIHSSVILSIYTYI